MDAALTVTRYVPLRVPLRMTRRPLLFTVIYLELLVKVTLPLAFLTVTRVRPLEYLKEELLHLMDVADNRIFCDAFRMVKYLVTVPV